MRQHRGGEFDGCIEIRFEALSPQDFALKLAGKLGLPVLALRNDAKAIALVSEWLNHKRILLLLDNVDDSEVTWPACKWPGCCSSLAVVYFDLISCK